MSYHIRHPTSFPLSDRDKLHALIKEAGFKRTQLARQLEVTYRTVHRWIDGGVSPHPAQSRRIDELFKEHVDLSCVIEKLKKSIRDPIAILKKNTEIQKRFFLEMTY